MKLSEYKYCIMMYYHDQRWRGDPIRLDGTKGLENLKSLLESYDFWAIHLYHHHEPIGYTIYNSSEAHIQLFTLLRDHQMLKAFHAH